MPASEGLSVLVLDCRAFGGQAGASARIENYLGFPTGITRHGADGARLQSGAEVRGRDGDPGRGARPRVRRATARPLRAARCQRRAGQRPLGRDRQRRALPAARRREPRRVRGRRACTTGPRRSKASCAPGRRSRWSAPAIRPARRWSIWRARSPRSGCWCAARDLGGEHVALSRRPHQRPRQRRGGDAARRSPASKASDGMLEAIRWRDAASGEETRRPIRHLFLFIGAEPNTDWLAGSGVALDAKGFVLTGADAGEPRAPLETSRARRVRDRRRPLRLGQARRRGGRRRRAGGGDAARLSGGGRGADRIAPPTRQTPGAREGSRRSIP